MNAKSVFILLLTTAGVAWGDLIIVPAKTEPAFRNIYVPMEDLDVLFNARKGVLLDRQEFISLWRQAYPNGRPEEKASTDLFLTHGDYEAKPTDKALEITGVLQIINRSPGWQAMGLRLAGVSIASATLDDEPARIGLDERQVPRLFLDKPGTHQLKLVLTTPFGQGAAVRSARFRLPPAPGELKLALADKEDVRVGGAVQPHPKAGDGAKNEVHIPVGGRDEFQLAIVSAAGAGERSALLVVHESSEVALTPAQIDWRDQLAIDVAAKSLDALEIDLPSEFGVIGVESEGLVRWDFDRSRGRLSLRYQSIWTGQRTVRLHAVAPASLNAAWKAPKASVVGAAVQTGVVRLKPEDSLSIELKSVRSGRRTSPPNVADPSLHLAYWRSDFAAEAIIRSKVQKLATSVANLITAGRSRLELVSSITIEPRNAPLFDVTLSLADGWTVTAVEVDGRSAAFHPVLADGKQRMLITLPAPIPADHPVAVVVRADRSPEAWLSEPGKSSTTPLTIVAVEGASEVEGVMMLRSPDEIRLWTADLAGLESLPVASLPGADAEVRLGFRYRTQEVAGKVQATLLPAQLIVETGIGVQLSKTHLFARYRIHYQIRGGVADTLTFELPKLAANQVRVRLLSGDARLVSQNVVDLADGRRQWQLKFDRDLRRSAVLEATAEMERDPAKPVDLPVLSVDGSVRQAGAVAVGADSDQELKWTADDSLRSIDPSELPASLADNTPAGRLVASLQYRRVPYRLSLSVIDHPEVGVLSAVCPEAKILSVVDASGAVRNQANLVIQNAGLQNLIVKLPKGSSLLSATLDGSPIEIRRSAEDSLISLPTASSDARVQVVLIYDSPTANRGISRSIEQSAPQMNLPVLHVDWTVYVPSDVVVTDSDGLLRPAFPLRRHTIISTIRDAITPTGGRRIFNPLELVPIFSVRESARYSGRYVKSEERVEVNTTQAPSEMSLDANVSGLKGDMEGGVQFGGQARPGAPSPSASAATVPSDRFSQEPMYREGFDPNPRKNMQLRDSVGGAVPVLPPQVPFQTLDENRRELARKAELDGIRADKDVNRQFDAPVNGMRRDSDLRDSAGVPLAKALAPKLGLLSLSMAVMPVGREYKFTGLKVDAPLSLSIQNETFAWTLSAVTAAAIVLAGWMYRDRRPAARARWVVLLFAVAIGGSAIVPLEWSWVLDGLLIGAYSLLILYLLRAMATFVSGGMTASAVAAMLLLAGSDPAVASEPAAAKVIAPRETPKLPVVYIPYAAGSNPFGSRQVYVPQAEYQTIWNAAHPDQAVIEDLKIASLVSSVKYDGTIVSDQARFQATMTIWSFRDEWVSVQLPIGGVIVSEVSLDGLPAVLSRGDRVHAMPRPSATPKTDPKAAAHRPEIYVRGRGRHELSMKFDIPIERSGATGSLVLRLAPTGVANLSLKLPEKNLEVQATNAAGGWRSEGDRFQAAVGAGGDLTIRWHPRDQRLDADLLASVEQKVRIEIRPADLRYLAQLDYIIRQGTMQVFEIQIPDSVSVRSVSGEAVADWSVVEQGGVRLLTIRNSRQLTGAVSLRVDLLAPLGEQGKDGKIATSVPAVVPRKVVRETGVWAVFADPLLDVSLPAAIGLEQMDRANFHGPAGDPASSPWPMLAAYRYSARPAKLDVGLTARQGKLASKVLSSITIETERVRLRSQVTLEQTGLEIVSGRLALPGSFVIDAVEAPDGVRWTILQDGDLQIVEVERTGVNPTPAAKGGPQVSSLTVSIEGWQPRTGLTVKVPAVEVPGAQRQTGQWAVFLAPGLDAETDSLSGLFPITPRELDSNLCAADHFPPCGPARLAFRQDRWPVDLTVKLSLLKPRVRATTVAVVSVRETAVAYVTQMTFTIEEAGVRQFAFTAPAWLGEDLDIQGVGIRQIESTAIDGERRKFDVSLDRAVLGNFVLRIAQSQPLPPAGVVKAPRLVPQGVEASTEYVILENRSPDQIDSLSDQSARTERIELDAIPVAISAPLRGSAIEASRYLDGNGDVAWRVRSAQKVEGLAASVNLADLTMVVDENGDYRAQANYRVSNRQEQFLTLWMPNGAKVWSVYVAGRPTRLAQGTRDGQPVVLVPLPKTAAGDFSSIVELVYQGTLVEEGQWVKTWNFPAPIVIGLPVAETQWTLYLPPTFNYSMFRGTLEPADPQYLDLNRQATEFREAFQLLSVAREGRGAAKQKALDNLRSYEIRGLGQSFDNSSVAVHNLDQADEKTRFLSSKVQSEASQLGLAINELRRQSASPVETGGQVNWDEYFPTPAVQLPAPNSSLNEQRGLKRAKKSANLGDLEEKAAPQAVRGRLQERLEQQAESLNRAPDNVKMKQQKAGTAGKEEQAQQMDRQLAQAPVDQLAAAQDDVSARSDLGRAPVRVGGLSLRIAIPRVGSPLHFATARGEAALAMTLYRTEWQQSLVGLVWLLVCLLIYAAFSRLIERRYTRRALERSMFAAILLIGFVWWLALPASAFGFLIVFTTAFVWAIRAVLDRRWSVA